MPHLKHLGPVSTAAALAACYAFTVAVSAQSGSSGAPQRGATASEPVTVIGCVERADQFNPSGASTLGTTLDSMDFVLVKAGEAGATASEPASAVGTAGTIGPMYRLIGDGSDGANLNERVGQKVEITGTREGTDIDNAAAQAANATNPSAQNAPRLRVQSIKTLAESCPK
jgi:hypothetical protein